MPPTRRVVVRPSGASRVTSTPEIDSTARASRSELALLTQTPRAWLAYFPVDALESARYSESALAERCWPSALDALDETAQARSVRSEHHRMTRLEVGLDWSLRNRGRLLQARRSLPSSGASIAIDWSTRSAASQARQESPFEPVIRQHSLSDERFSPLRRRRSNTFFGSRLHSGRCAGSIASRARRS